MGEPTDRQTRRTATLADRLDAAGAASFVGRAHELERLESALDLAASPIRLVHLRGPAGIGKSTLLAHLAARGRAYGISTVHLDAHGLGGDGAHLIDALGAAVGSSKRDLESILRALDACSPVLLCIDTFEELAPLLGWLRESLLPRFPAATLVATAGRDPLPPGWRTDPRWRGLTMELGLTAFDRAESEDLLRAWNVPPDRWRELHELAGGLPLALALLAELVVHDPEADLTATHSAAALTPLVRRLLEEAPDALHAQALEAAAMVRTLNADLLASMLDVDHERAEALFEWLAARPWVRYALGGIRPHDAVRELLRRHLEWRSPGSRHRLVERALRHAEPRFLDHDSERRLTAFEDFLYLATEFPLAEQIFGAWREAGLHLEPAGGHEDVTAFAGMVAEHHGDASARLLDAWCEGAPPVPGSSTAGRLLMVRDAEGRPEGGLLELDLVRPSADELELDPMLAALWAHVEETGGLGPGQGMRLTRFWTARGTGQAPSPVQTRIFLRISEGMIEAPEQAIVASAIEDPDQHFPAAEAFGVRILARAEVGGRTFGWVGYDWRRADRSTWMSGIVDHLLASAGGPSPGAPSSRRIAMDPDAFQRAVRKALRDFPHPERLASNPLIETDLAGDADDPLARAEALRDRIAAVVSGLGASEAPTAGGDAELLRATYLEPRGKQTMVAVEFGLNFSTYRYQLDRAVGRLADRLRLEVAGG